MTKLNRQEHKSIHDSRNGRVITKHWKASIGVFEFLCTYWEYHGRIQVRARQTAHKHS